MTLTEKVAFIKGLVEGSELKLEKKQEKIFNAILDLLDDMANTITEVDEDVSVLYEEVDGITEELNEIGIALYDLDEEEDEDFADDEFMYEIECDKCGEKIVVDEEALLNDGFTCPHCGEPIEFEFDCDCDDCCDDDCDCHEK